jgi:hypothetical protein
VYRKVNCPSPAELRAIVAKHRTMEAAADSLGIHARTLSRWLARAGIKVDRQLVPRSPAAELPWWRRLAARLAA